MKKLAQHVNFVQTSLLMRVMTVMIKRYLFYRLKS